MRRLPFSVVLLLIALLIAVVLPVRAAAVELKISRAALDRTLKQQMFNGPDGRYYLKGDAKSACAVYAEKPELSFDADRVLVKIKTHAKLGTSIAGKCIGVNLSPAAEVSMIPDAQGETIGFRDARVEHVSDSKELNFLLMPFLKNQIPSSLKVNAADVLRKALEGSTLSTGYTLTLDRLKIHSMVIQGDWLIVDVDGDMSVK
ncbi:hypothetical protein [Acidicapsa ligni]|uniref:hypothetical protein n=1 Tax=Acidicapsa ligni TaxID=542300 RepID=UPI0021E0CA4C|nr:hypothetical protein [Acidicapsa ligni]